MINYLYIEIIMLKFIEYKTPNIIIAYKPIGKTPLELINLLKQNTRYKNTNTKMSYAGRLDPMARGLMIILLNDECYRQNLYHNFDKIYEFKLLLGISTDTFDILGKITNNLDNLDNIYLDNNQYEKIIYGLIGKNKQEYPSYSAVRVKGHPLWYYAKNNILYTLNSEDIPKKDIMVYNIQIISYSTISKNNLLEIVNKNISSLDIKNNFRQKEILQEWKEIKCQNYKIIKIKSKVSCGTYIRSLCNIIGRKLEVPSLALDIYRTKIDKYDINLIT